LYNILIEHGVPITLFRLINMCSDEMYDKSLEVNICLVIFLYKMVYIKEMLYHHSFSTLLYNIRTIRMVQEHQIGASIKGTHQLLAYADDMNLLGDNIHPMK
jgi:hypothetical protein